MSTKWIFLTCVLSLGAIETSQAHPLDSRDIVYIDGLPCNSACQSYMAWSRQALSASGLQAPAQLRQRVKHEAAHRTKTIERKLTSSGQALAARQAIPLPPARVAALQPANSADKPDGSSDQTTGATMAPSPDPKPNNNDHAVGFNRPEIAPPGDVEKTASAPPSNADNPAPLPAGNAAADSNAPTQQDQSTAAAVAPAPDHKADSGDRSDRPETIQSGDTKEAAPVKPYDMARLEPAGSTVAGSSTRPIQEQLTAATVIAEHVVTLRDAEKAASGSRSNADQMVALLIARPEITSISDLAGKDVAMDDRHAASHDKVQSAIAAAGAAEVHLSEGQTRAINRLIGGEVPAAVLALLYPETGFPQFAGFKIFRIPLMPRSPNARL